MTILETNAAHSIIRIAKSLEEIEKALKRLIEILTKNDNGKAETQD